MGLMKIEEAAEALNVPAASLKTAAQKHGMLVRMGRALRIDPETIPELLQRCRENPQAPASISDRTTAPSSFATPGNPTGERARETAAKLKKRSPRISQGEASSPVVVPLRK